MILPTHHFIADVTKEQQVAMHEIEALFQVPRDKLDFLMHGVGQEMRNGLQTTQGSDLKMIPSFVTGTQKKKKFFLIFFSRR